LVHAEREERGKPGGQKGGIPYRPSNILGKEKCGGSVLGVNRQQEHGKICANKKWKET